MRRFALTQRQINLGMFALITLAALALLLDGLIRPGGPRGPFGPSIGSVVAAALFVAYWRGWEPARYAVVLAIVVLLSFVIEEPFITQRFDPVILVPTVVALVLCNPPTVLASGVAVMLIMLARAGWTGVYAGPAELTAYGAIIGGMILSRLAVDNAEHLATANIRADQARAEVEQRAAELGQRNTELQTLLAENAAQRDAIRDLSIPLLPLAEQTLVLPLVGTLDSARLLMAQECALAEIHARRTRVLIVDVTGVPLIDTQIARGLFDLISAARLLGATVILAGVRAEVAQTLATLGLDLSALLVERDVQSALARSVHARATGTL